MSRAKRGSGDNVVSLHRYRRYRAGHLGHLWAALRSFLAGRRARLAAGEADSGAIALPDTADEPREA